MYRVLAVFVALFFLFAFHRARHFTQAPIVPIDMNSKSFAISAVQTFQLQNEGPPYTGNTAQHIEEAQTWARTLSNTGAKAIKGLHIVLFMEPHISFRGVKSRSDLFIAVGWDETGKMDARLVQEVTGSKVDHLSRTCARVLQNTNEQLDISMESGEQLARVFDAFKNSYTWLD